ncbi:Adenylate cyclase [Grifola frondosa]|uniref:Adenylate cyclase n=1 Tax=Grifola frondosa TaxID=5627 RepID=A0A1C7M1Q3_GRIFR|nr:Adenylate cyclase [Grifola frondosa]
MSQGLIPDQELLPHAPSTEEGNLVIAPWLRPDEESEPPTPPPKSTQQRFGFPTKPSLHTFTIPRQPSTSSLSISTARPSDTTSIHSTDSLRTYDSRKSKSSLNILTNIMKKRSRSRLRSDATVSSDPVPPLPSPDRLYSFLPLPSPRPGHSPTKLDTNLDEMEGIVDVSLLPPTMDSSSPGSGFESSHQSSSSLSSVPAASGAHSGMFSNPFLPTPTRKLAPGAVTFDGRKISPKTRPPPPPPPPSSSTGHHGDDDSPSWTAPESWAVEKEGEDALAPYSSSDESMRGGTKRKPKRRKPVGGKVLYKIRIYRANNTYHVVSIDLAVTVAELTPQLNKKLLLDPTMEPHRLYLKERGRERVLAQTERPADIVRRRLVQAGYDVADGLDLLGADDIQFLLKFVYKSNALGPAEEELPFDTFDLVDLTGRSLKAVPVPLYAHADAIVLLNLSRNPMLEIPLDFIQSCTTLRELRLSHMAMKKVPQSVRHCRTLHRLDISCNRIADLEDAGLDRIPELRSLKVQNNRMEKLPWYFPRMRALKDLNISNNKFKHVPAVVSEIANLVDLDISFNMISELPEELGQLHALERLIIVGNQVTRFPDECSNLRSLRMLDCRRNNMGDLSVVCLLPKIEELFADHNSVHALDLSFGPSLKQLDASQNDITQLIVVPGPLGQPFALTSLDISHAKLSALDELALSHLTALEVLRIDHNSIRFIPESLGELKMLSHLSCSNNNLYALPASIGRLQNLEMLEAHNNNLEFLPISLWNCASLQLLNVTSNLISSWPLPTAGAGSSDTVGSPPGSTVASLLAERKTSSASTISGHPLPHWELRVLNLSFNDLQELPATFFRNLTHLRELYLSGNKFSAIPTEDLHRLTTLEVLFLNGNKLQTIPLEISKLTNLSVMDVGSNNLKYNINNWEFDWNWNFNTNLRYLNLSGNKRLEIKPAQSNKHTYKDQQQQKVLSDFSQLTQLRILGLMDVTTFLTNIPDENEDRRVRTSMADVNGMAYGIADTLGMTEHLTMLDLVQPNFRKMPNEAIFAMFGRASHVASNNRLTKYLHDNFLDLFTQALDNLNVQKGEGVPEAMRRSFLKLNKLLHDHLYSSSSRKLSHVSSSTAVHDLSSVRSGASGIVLYLVDKTLYVANAGNALAVISRQGEAVLLSRKHDPFDRAETARIRAAEGWVSPKGCVNDEIDVSRSFGFYYLLPVINPLPDVRVWELSELDEFVIIGNRGLWDFVSHQTAVDIARSERDPMIAAQKLRDFAISYGAEGTTMIMVIKVADLFKQGIVRSRLPTVESLMDQDVFQSLRRRKRDEITNRDIARLDDEVPPPVGHLALVFTDIRNSTHLWEVNPGMQSAMVLHNNLLRRLLRFCGGYEVKTEGDAFMCSFPTTLSALWWCLNVQVQLLAVPWPLEILECEDGKEIYDSNGKLIARGLSVRMGIHCGQPVCEPDPITHRMDYFGPMVNRAARVNGLAAGGQIMCSADVIKEINARIFENGPETEQSYLQPAHAIDAIRRLGVAVVNVGEMKLKGLEVPESLSAVYPEDLVGRQDLEASEPASNGSGSRVQFSVEQMREFGLLCVRLETLASRHIFKPLPARKGSTAPQQETLPEDTGSSLFVYDDPNLFLPVMDKTSSDTHLMGVLHSLSQRIENALARLGLNYMLMSLRGKELICPRSTINSWLYYVRSTCNSGSVARFEDIYALLCSL